MNLGNNLFQARKKVGLSQETVAEKLGVSRQTVSKWETDETVPDIYQAKKLAKLYNLTLDELIEFDIDVKEIEEVIKNYNKKKSLKSNERYNHCFFPCSNNLAISSGVFFIPLLYHSSHQPKIR